MKLFDWARHEPFTLEDAVRGFNILGQTGSGKTSGSGAFLARMFLRHGFGGLVMVAKADEALNWRTYCEQTGRLNDLIVFSPTQPHRFNFLDWEVRRPGVGAGLTENILQLLMNVCEIGQRGGSSGGGREENAYWEKTMRQLLRNVIDLAVIATGRVSVPDLYKLVVTAPTSFEQVASESWRENSYCWQCLQRGDAATKRGYQLHDFQLVADYLLIEYPGLSEKIRSIIVSTFTSLCDVLHRGVIRELFCTATTVTPEDCLAGKIIVVNLPVKVYAEVGQYAAVIFKYLFQRCVERRDVSVSPRPCFLFADEAHLFTTSFDAQFQSTARSAKCATVYLSQNLQGYLSAYRGASGEADTKSLWGNLCTTIIHALGDADTARHVADLIGRRRQFFQSGNISHQPYHPIDDYFQREQGHVSMGFSESLEYEIEPCELTQMRTGGAANGGIVDALVWRAGQPFRTTQRNYLWTTFHQGRA